MFLSKVSLILVPGSSLVTNLGGEIVAASVSYRFKDIGGTLVLDLNFGRL